MFSTGQFIFAGFFVVAFTLIIFMSYKRDQANIRQNFKGSFWVVIGFFLFITALVLIKKIFIR